MLSKKPFIFFIIILYLLVLTSCDEFLVKKTVAVTSIEGDLNFDPVNVALFGQMNYVISNDQTNNLSEIYLECHGDVTVDEISYKDILMRYEQGTLYGLDYYRIRIPNLNSSEIANISVKFHIVGPVQENQFFFNRDKVFIEAYKVWLPVPFANSPESSYKIKIQTPENYYSIMGAKLTNESVTEREKICCLGNRDQ